jgi:chromosome partitioning protein
MIESAGRNFCFVVSQAKSRTRLAMEVVPALAQHGKVAPVIIYDRIEFPTVALEGKAVVENGESMAAAEIRNLYTYVRKHLRMEVRK